MNAPTPATKRTNVRSLSPALRAVRATMGVLGPHAPSLASRWAEEMFLTPRRRPRPEAERALLRSATALRVPFRGAHLPAWTWAPPGDEGAPVAILVHGWESRGAQLGAFVAPLVARGLRVVAFDAPGHGDAPLRRASVVEHARALVAVMAHVAPGGVHAVVGHSVGGAAALLATRFGLRAQRLVLLAPPTSPARFIAGFSRMFRLDERIKTGMLLRLEARYGIPIADLDVRLDAAGLEQPVLVVHDEDDAVVPWSDGVAIAGATPHGELMTTRGLGHNRVLQASEVVARVAAFVAPAPFEATLEGELFHRDTRR